MEFASDNTSGAAPGVLAAVVAASEGYAPSYGTDQIMHRVTARIRDLFETPEAAVFLVATGTAANSLALACLTPPWGGVFCHEHAHVHEDECGAPEFFTGGAKLIPVAGAHGRMSPAALAAAIDSPVHGSVHGVQPGAVSITNATEAGTVYTPAMVAELAGVAKARGLPVHMDGARFANALASCGASPAEMTWKSGIDALSLGGSKNGCLGVEAVVLFDPAKAWEFELRRKRAGHLFSKHRFLAAQMEAYLHDGLWMSLAQTANARAARLAEGLRTCPGATVLHPVEANIVFAALPRGAHRRAMAAGARYYLVPGDPDPDGPPGDPVGCRLVCSWSTTEEDVARLLDVIRG